MCYIPNEGQGISWIRVATPVYEHDNSKIQQQFLINLGTHVKDGLRKLSIFTLSQTIHIKEVMASLKSKNDLTHSSLIF